MDPHSMTDDALAAHMASLTEPALLALLAEMDAQQAPTPREYVMGDAARYYASVIGWPVFPCRPRGKQPLTRHGFKDATRDLNTIASWWMRWPEANIGTPTGADGCGLDVIDVDGHQGFRSLAELRHGNCPPNCCDEAPCPALGPLPASVARCWTPGDDGGAGWHLYIPPTGAGNDTHIVPGIDYRGAGGYVILPPSLGANGKRYEWLEDERPAPRAAVAA
jgi:hypothetical protein